MRIRIIQKPLIASIDGIRLDRFDRGYEYDVGNSLGALLLAEGWAEPVALEEPAVEVPFSEADPFAPGDYRDADAPPNLVREHYPPCLDQPVDLAADFKRRKRERRG
jgi:hypothetical protein